MRFLFAGPGAAGHVFPMISTAQALRAAGHEVLLAGAAPIGMLRGTGLATVDVGDGSSLSDAFRRIEPEAGYVGKRSEEEVMRLAARGFAEHGRSAVAGLLEVAGAWEPDVLVHAPFQAAAPLVAAKLGIPRVSHNFGVMSGTSMAGAAAEILADVYREHGLDGPAEASAVVDVVPPSLGGGDGGWRVRYVPFNGAGPVPRELLRTGGRPRVVVTLGTVLTQWDGVRSVLRLVEQAAAVDADFLLAVEGADLAPLGELPANVSALPWVPLAELLGAADAVVHHGGSGTMLTAAAVGVPQLLLPQGADHFTNADAAVAQGCALRAEDEEVDAALLERLLSDERLVKGARTLKAEIEAQPSPAELVARFEQLVG